MILDSSAIVGALSGLTVEGAVVIDSSTWMPQVWFGLLRRLKRDLIPSDQ